MQFPSLHLAQKIAGTITLLSISTALLLVLILGSEITKSTEKTSTEFLTAMSVHMHENLKKNYVEYQKIKSKFNQKDAQLGEDFWLGVVENTLTNLPQNLEALILDAEGNILAPKHMKNDITQAMRQRAIAAADKGALVANSDKGRITGMTRTLLPNKYYLSIYYLHDNLKDVLWQRQVLLIQITIGIVTFGILLALLLSKHLANPIQRLSTAATMIPNTDLQTENIWKDLPPLPLERKDEIGTLAHSFHYMVEKLQKNLAQTLELTVAKEKVANELRLAHTIQQSILPKDFTPQFTPTKANPIPQVHGLVLPAREVGGDLFDAFWLDEEHFCFAIGDVSDKGVPAALFMSITLTLIRSLMRNDESKNNPAKVLGHINNALCQDNTSNMFVTLIVGILHCKSGTITFANAGHTPPLCLKHHGDLEILPTHKEMVVASFDDITYTNIHYTLQSGDRIFCYTDGVNEALNTQGQRLGDAALHTYVQQGQNLSPQALNEDILHKIQIFSDKTPQYDDITLLNFLWNDSKS